MKTFTTDLYSLAKLNDNKYVIPTYQRPYVWGDEQIEKLLWDFFRACERGENYYLGTVVASINNGEYELIDGQQRFTTMWLIAYAFRKEGVNSKLDQFLTISNNNDTDLRITFSIRKQVEVYLKYLLASDQSASKSSTEEIHEKDVYLEHIAAAITRIRSSLLEMSFDKFSAVDFGNYIYEKVLFIKNVAPKHTDLNKLFTTLNNNGIQLEQSDILKSKLLKVIKTEKFIYAKMWEVCENMSNYFERNVLDAFRLIDRTGLQERHFAEFNENIFFTTNAKDDDIEKVSLEEIIRDVKGPSLDLEDSADKIKSKEIKCKSIITFPQLLLHTFRIYLFKKGYEDFKQPFHVNNLLEVFEPLESRTEVEEFFKLLWEVRYLFDKYVIKWRDVEGEDELALTYITRNENTFSRPPMGRSNISMLQSLLYFTSDYNTQIWLTTYLYKLLNGNTEERALEQIDNQLSLVVNKTLKDATWELLKNNNLDEACFDFQAYLKKPNGTRFKHYWFYKVEYLLWKEWNKDDEKVFDYRITSKNSIEHVFPQNEEYDGQLEKEWLDSFGNLGLLSVSQNSSYSNQKVQKKLVDFAEKSTYDSLKLAKIYRSDHIKKWGVDGIEKHRDEILNLLTKHYYDQEKNSIS